MNNSIGQIRERILDDTYTIKDVQQVERLLKTLRNCKVNENLQKHLISLLDMVEIDNKEV